jgi:hypothetical protein
MKTPNSNNKDWTETSGKVFWGEIAPYDHVVQIYENDETFLRVLVEFVQGGFEAEDSVIIIATEGHLESLNERLRSAGYDVNALIADDLFIPLEATEVLSRFMVNGWPDENLFLQLVTNLIKRARRNNRQVRAFGEMVAILWAQGKVGATVRLEHLWDKFCQAEAFCLFCAYPESGFTQDAAESVTHICGAHSKMIKGSGDTRTGMVYKSTPRQTA